MCTGVEPLLMAGAGAAAASSLLAPKAPSMPDPAVERAKAEAEATQKANAKIAMQRKAMRANSLLTGAGDGGTMGAPSATAPAASGRTTLGV